MRKAAKRDGNEGAIVEALRQRGASVIFLNMADAPDLLVGFTPVVGSPTIFLIEVKTTTGKLRPGQVRWHQEWRGRPVAVVRSVEEALEVLEDANLRIPVSGLPGDTNSPTNLSRGSLTKLPPMWW